MKNSGNYLLKKSELLVAGFVRIMCIPDEIVRLIHAFFDKELIFSVYDRFGHYIIKDKCKRIHINGSSLFFIDKTDHLWVYGDDTFGQLGMIVYKNMCIRQKFFVNKDTDIISEGVCNDHCFIKTSEYLYGFGNNNVNQISNGLGKRVQYPIIMEHEFKSNLMEIKCGVHHSLFLTEKGNVYGFGFNEGGQLTDKYNNNINKIQLIINSGNIVNINCNGRMSFILDKNNILKAFGSNKCINWVSYEPIIMFKGFKINKIDSGRRHIGILTMNNKLYMFGGNKYCQCGRMQSIAVKIPNEIILDNIVTFKCGGYHAIIKTGSNEFYSFGKNQNQRLLHFDNESGLCVPEPKIIPKKCIHKITKSNALILDILPSWDTNYIIQI